MASPMVWFLAGLAAPKMYAKFSAEEKSKWEKKCPLHHGEAGIMMMAGGLLSRNLGLAAFGTGLVVEDWKDRKEWFKKKSPDSDKKIKNNKKRKKITIN